MSSSITAVVREDGNVSPAFARLVARFARDDNWHHFALVRHGDRDVELYLDGRPSHKIAGSWTSGAITTDLRALGSERRWVATGWAATHYLKGAIDEVCVFARSLDPVEIKTLAGRP